MRLIRLQLRNFQGVKDFTLEPNGQNISVFGDNGTGKTTLFSAFTWLLFSKNSQGKTDFEIKTLNPDGTPVHGLDHEVEAVLELQGKQITLKKVFKEKWQKKRGSAEQQFIGHTTDYFINGVPVKQKDYQARIAEIADENIFKLLTNPKYFNEQLHWQKRREILLEVCGDITDEEVIASDKRLAKLADVLGDYKLDEYKDMIKAKRKKINDELEKIPIRIDEATRGLPDIEGLNAERATEKIAILKDSIRKREQAISRIDSGGEIAEKTKQLREIEAELQGIKNSHYEALQKQFEQKQKLLNEISSNVQIQSAISALKKDLQYNIARIESLEEEMNALRNGWNTENERKFEFEQGDTCPTCGQKLPAEKLEEARQKALEAFNLEKAEKLQNITAEGKKKKAEVVKLQEENKNIEAQIEKLTKQHEQEQEQSDSLRREIAALQEKFRELPPLYDKKLKIKEELEAAIAGLKDGSKDEKAKLYEEIAALEESVREAERVLADINTYNQGQKRIEELKEQERKLAAEYAKLEEALFLTEEFTRTKVKMLEEKINSKFKMARFKLFNTLVNGGVEETAETTYEGVPYNSGLNAGHQIIVGMDIIRTLSEHYGFYPPIFVDNAEAVTDLPEMPAQVIRLVKPEIETEEDRKRYSKLVVDIKEKIKEAV